jgi:hypothetical protein
MANGLPLQNLEYAGQTHDKIDQSSQNRGVTEQGRHKVVAEQPDQTSIQCANDNQHRCKNIDKLHVFFSFTLIQNSMLHERERSARAIT